MGAGHRRGAPGSPRGRIDAVQKSGGLVAPGLWWATAVAGPGRERPVGAGRGVAGLVRGQSQLPIRCIMSTNEMTTPHPCDLPARQSGMVPTGFLRHPGPFQTARTSLPPSAPSPLRRRIRRKARLVLPGARRPQPTQRTVSRIVRYHSRRPPSVLESRELGCRLVTDRYCRPVPAVRPPSPSPCCGARRQNLFPEPDSNRPPGDYVE